MKRSDIRSFVERYLAYRGARVEPVGPDLLDVAYRSDASFGADGGRQLAFGARAHRSHPAAELVAVGSAFLDRLVGAAARGGKYTVTYRPRPSGKGCKPSRNRLPEVEGGTWTAPRPGYRPVFLFVYTAEYRTIDVPDDLELIPLDPLHCEVHASPSALLDGLGEGSAEPADGWRAAATLPSPGTLLSSLNVLDRRLQRRARKVKEAAALEVSRETANIEAYYRQLIEEVRHPVGRGRLSPEDEIEHVRRLQLDWKRRVQEVASFWGVGASIRLSALAVLMEPCWVMLLRGQKIRGRRRGSGVVYAAADYASGALLDPRCALCGAKIRRRAACVGADLVCRPHTADAETLSVA
jgi:hypothetical protein